MKRIIVLLSVGLITLCAVSAFAQQNDVGEDGAAALKEEVQQLRNQVEQQQRAYKAQLEKMQQKLDELSKTQAATAAKIKAKETAEPDIETLRRAAEKEAAQETSPEKEPTDITFKSGGIGLQALNPEISVTGDMIFTYSDEADVTQDFNFRGLGLHFEAYLDPYSRFKAAVPVNADGAELGEAYFTRYGVLRNVNLTLGKFRQQFGVVNRWHKHGLDWIDFPLPLRQVFGDGGLNQVGASLDWNGSIGDTSQELTLQLTDGENGRIFRQNTKNRPSVLLHYKNYRDISANTYLELGLTGMLGWNDQWQTTGPAIVDETRDVQVYGLDFTLLWEPTERMRYRNLEWRSELYYVNKNILASDGSGKDTLNPWGAYSSLQSKVSRTVDIGIRADYYQPEVKSYANLDGLSLSPLAVTEDDAYRWLGAVYATWHQSPFVKFRVEYDHEDGKGMSEPEDRVMLQCIFSAGPHKHERY